MGALTDSRKRVSADHRLHPSFPPSPPPPSKRTKLAPLLPVSSPPPLHHSSPSTAAPGPSAAAAAAASTSSPSSLPHPRLRLPPAPPIPRPIHGPQRVRRCFRGGNSRPNSNPSWYSTSPPPQPLGLDQYADLVYRVTHPPRPTPPVDVPRGSEAIPEVVTVDDCEDRKHDKEDEQDVEEEGKAKVVGRKVPLYKELYEKSSRQRDARLRTLEFEVQLAEKGRLGLELLAEVLPRIMPNKEEVPEPFVPLTDEDEDNVCHALGGRNRSETLSVHEASNIVITREILRCLNDKEWLNDEVINLYLELLKERELREPNKFLKCHFFNTFFYKKLINGGYDYKSVRRWTTKRKLGYSLIDCDKIFVPIHKDVHWCLAVINIRDKKFQYLDSLGYMDLKALRILANYLVDEVKDKSGKQIDAVAWKQEGVQNLPLQENGWDCGMFMLKYIDFYSRDMDLVFGQKHMSYFRRRTAKEILDLRAG